MCSETLATGWKEKKKKLRLWPSNHRGDLEAGFGARWHLDKANGLNWKSNLITSVRESSESSWLLWKCDTKPWRATNKNRVVDLKFFGRLLPWFTAPRGCGASSEPQLRAGMSLSRGVKLRRYFRLCESSPVNQDVADNGQGCLGRASGQLAVKVPLLI